MCIRDRPRRLWLRRILWAALAVAVLGLLFVGISYATIKPPKPNDIATAQASVIYYCLLYTSRCV